jgi:nucleotide-binding universal stress UspA family protein
MNQLLVLINDINNSEPYIRYAAGFAHDLNLSVHFLYVFNPLDYPLGIPGTTGSEVQFTQENVEREKEKSSKLLEDMLKKLDSDISVLKSVQYFVEIGLTSDIVDQYTKDKKVKMVMLEANDGGSNFSFSELNMDIIRKVECPVFVVPDNVKYHSFSHIVYATDYKEEDIDTLKKLAKIAGRYHARINSLHISDHAGFTEKIKSEGFDHMVSAKVGYDRINMSNLPENHHESMIDVLQKYAAGIKADMIVVLRENRNFLERIFKKSEIRRLISKSNIPVMVYHAGREE